MDLKLYEVVSDKVAVDIFTPQEQVSPYLDVGTLIVVSGTKVLVRLRSGQFVETINYPDLIELCVKDGRVKKLVVWTGLTDNEIKAELGGASVTIHGFASREDAENFAWWYGEEGEDCISGWWDENCKTRTPEVKSYFKETSQGVEFTIKSEPG